MNSQVFQLFTDSAVRILSAYCCDLVLVTCYRPSHNQHMFIMRWWFYLPDFSYTNLWLSDETCCIPWCHLYDVLKTLTSSEECNKYKYKGISIFCYKSAVALILSFWIILNVCWQIVSLYSSLKTCDACSFPFFYTNLQIGLSIFCPGEALYIYVKKNSMCVLYISRTFV